MISSNERSPIFYQVPELVAIELETNAIMYFRLEGSSSRRFRQAVEDLADVRGLSTREIFALIEQKSREIFEPPKYWREDVYEVPRQVGECRV